MKVPFNWLEEFVQTGLTAEDLAHRLTMAGLEVEALERIGDGWDRIFVGEVLHITPHPDADRLVLAEVAAGDHRLTVVTGAPNIVEGQRVPLALAGARLFDSHSSPPVLKTLKPGIIRGIRSEGMVCSEKELGLSDEHEGIMVLEPNAPIGAPLEEWLGNIVFDFEITPNLVHAFSVFGIAREAAALTGRPLSPPPVMELQKTNPETERGLITLDAPDLCSRYAAVDIEGITVGPSPAWLARRLTAAGIRPINNVVDITNYVMLETGQPLHAFDRDRFADGRIVVRRARESETFVSLDHQSRQLSTDMLVIADSKRPVAIAGLIGGLESEVSDSTTSILLESAHFNMTSVRHTARALHLRTEASARFERGLDPSLVKFGASRATRMILDLCPGSQAVGFHDVYPSPISARSIEMAFSRIERLLGVRFELVRVLEVLSRLGFEPRLHGTDLDSRLSVNVPTWRSDVTLPEDLIEEVARIIGYDRLPESLPSGAMPPVVRDPLFALQRTARRTLVAAGCFEVITHITVSPESLAAFTCAENDKTGFLHQIKRSELARLRNPVQEGKGLLRPTLVPSLLENAATNLKHSQSVRICELARVYLPSSRGPLPIEANLVGLLLTGKRQSLELEENDEVTDFFDLKGVVEITLARCGVINSLVRTTSHPALHPGRTAEVLVGGTRVALFGELRPDVTLQYGIEQSRVCVAEIDLDELLAGLESTIGSVRVPRYLPVWQDFAVIIDESVPAAEVAAALRQGGGALLREHVLFDIFRGTQIGAGKKSLAYRLTFEAPDRALTDAELIKTRGSIERVLAKQVGGVLRK
ncbi:MAG: phenylalanine--tRNA ligase subunit beta [Chloroflexia bacterium]|nr:phenylalanine--tRNA ligase subunit beta [Chloroflexia bacterium]